MGTSRKWFSDPYKVKTESKLTSKQVAMRTTSRTPPWDGKEFIFTVCVRGEGGLNQFNGCLKSPSGSKHLEHLDRC